MTYEPPFKITAQSINMIAEIAAFVEREKMISEKSDDIKLRKINRMKTIHGTLAIEGNTLSEQQVTAIIDGKHVIAPLKEVQEVRNAIKVYDAFDEFDAYDWRDLLKAHAIMGLGLVDNPGHFRKGGVCVYGNEGVSHIAPPPDRVPFLIGDLFDWLKNSCHHILIKSCVFHYEFEFIHPFEDGNGRMGRFWQSKILSEWHPIFANIPIENMIWENQEGYYKAIAESTKNTDSGIFADFMLTLILHALKKHATKNETVNADNETVNSQIETVNVILQLLDANPLISYDEIAKKLGKSRATISRKIAELKKQGLIERIGADKNGAWKVVKNNNN